MIIRTILIDDEPKILHTLKLKLDKFCDEIEVVAQCMNIQEGYKAIVEYMPDLVFLDINMPHGSGFDLLQQFEEIDFAVVFVTGYSEYALQALKLSVIDYILKPIDTQELLIALEKVKKQLNKSIVENNAMMTLKHNIQHLGDQRSRICIPNNSLYEFIEIHNIIRCEADQKYTKLVLTSDRMLLSSKNIGSFVERLSGYDFFHVHKSHLVNNQHIATYSVDGVLTMSDGSHVPVSRRRKTDFHRHFINR